MTIHSESSIEKREAVTVVQAEMMVAWPMMVKWKWWDRRSFKINWGVGARGRESRLSP